MITSSFITLYDLLVENLRDKKGYVVFSIDDDESSAHIFHFETKEEFEKYFKLQEHPYYPSFTVVPTIIVNYMGRMVECIIDEHEYYINRDSIYCLINGTELKK